MTAISSSCPPKRPWEPTCSAVPGLSATHSECPPRSRAPRSTQSDRDRHPEPLWTSLTRKRSQVQILYGPRHFSKLCLAARAVVRASHLRLCLVVAGQKAAGCVPLSGNSLPEDGVCAC